jgi:hypothetical protein
MQDHRTKLAGTSKREVPKIRAQIPSPYKIKQRLTPISEHVTIKNQSGHKSGREKTQTRKRAITPLCVGANRFYVDTDALLKSVRN